MKIKPQKVFTPTGTTEASSISVSSILDNLVNSVVFRVSLQDADGGEVASTQVTLNDGDYPKWDATSDGAHRICAAKLGLVVAE